MKKIYALIGCTLLILSLAVTGCKPKVKPASERIAKAWTVESAKHGAAVVYTRGGTNNQTPAYSGFRLTLENVSGAKKVTLIDVDGVSCVGDWDMEGESKLILRNLTPPPTATGGTIEFTINSLEDSRIVLTRTTTSPKTGGTINEYTLTNP